MSESPARSIILRWMSYLLRSVRFHVGDRRPFLDRAMSFSYADGLETDGKLDWMLTEGAQNPRQPYFYHL